MSTQPKRKRVSRIDIDIRRHPLWREDREYWLCIVTVRGRSYFAVHSGDKPSEDAIAKSYRETHDTINWQPYNYCHAAQ